MGFFPMGGCSAEIEKPLQAARRFSAGDQFPLMGLDSSFLVEGFLLELLYRGIVHVLLGPSFLPLIVGGVRGFVQEGKILKIF